MRCGAALYEGVSPNPSFKDFLNMPVSDAELKQSGQPTHILKILGSGGRVVFQNASSPGNLIRLKAPPYNSLLRLPPACKGTNERTCQPAMPRGPATRHPFCASIEHSITHPAFSVTSRAQQEEPAPDVGRDGLVEWSRLARRGTPSQRRSR